VLFAQQGRTAEAVAEMRRVVELDPGWMISHYGLGAALLLAGEYREAAQELERAWHLAPHALNVRGPLAWAYHQSGRDEEALDAYLRGLPPDLAGYAGAMRRAFAAGGFQGLTRADVDWRVAKRGDPCTNEEGTDGHGSLGIVGEADEMFECLERLIDGGDQAPFLKTFSLYDPYRSDPRFTALLRRMNLAE
jgi:tetratricopeptide (TPR) repeat protein